MWGVSWCFKFGYRLNWIYNHSNSTKKQKYENWYHIMIVDWQPNSNTWCLTMWCPALWWNPLDRDLHGHNICTLCGNLHHTWNSFHSINDCLKYDASLNSPCFAVALLKRPVTGWHRQAPRQKKKQQQATTSHRWAEPTQASNSLSWSSFSSF